MAKNLTEKISLVWRSAGKQCQEIQRIGFAVYLKKNGLDISRSFEAPKTIKKNGAVLTCMDERTPGVFRISGSGIIFGVDYTVKIIKKASGCGARINAVSWHKGCGAAKKYAELNGLDKTQADKYAQEFAEEVSRKLKEQGANIAASETKVLPPKNFHNAICAYADFTGRFNSGKIKKLPRGFQISAKYHEDKIKNGVGKTRIKSPAIYDTLLALDIAFNPAGHGFGKRFSPKRPFRIITLCDRKERSQAKKFQGDLMKIVKTRYGERTVFAFLEIA